MLGMSFKFYELLINMRPYGRRNKFSKNYTDCHPPKGWFNWWEVEIGNDLSKSAVRRMAREQIQQELDIDCETDKDNTR